MRRMSDGDVPVVDVAVNFNITGPRSSARLVVVVHGRLKYADDGNRLVPVNSQCSFSLCYGGVCNCPIGVDPEWTAGLGLETIARLSVGRCSEDADISPSAATSGRFDLMSRRQRRLAIDCRAASVLSGGSVRPVGQSLFCGRCRRPTGQFSCAFSPASSPIVY